MLKHGHIPAVLYVWTRESGGDNLLVFASSEHDIYEILLFVKGLEIFDVLELNVFVILGPPDLVLYDTGVYAVQDRVYVVRLHDHSVSVRVEVCRCYFDLGSLGRGHLVLSLQHVVEQDNIGKLYVVCQRLEKV